MRSVGTLRCGRISIIQRTLQSGLQTSIALLEAVLEAVREAVREPKKNWSSSRQNIVGLEEEGARSLQRYERLHTENEALEKRLQASEVMNNNLRAKTMTLAEEQRKSAELMITLPEKHLRGLTVSASHARSPLPSLVPAPALLSALAPAAGATVLPMIVTLREYGSRRVL